MQPVVKIGWAESRGNDSHWNERGNHHPRSFSNSGVPQNLDLPEDEDQMAKEKFIIKKIWFEQSGFCVPIFSNTFSIRIYGHIDNSIGF